MAFDLLLQVQILLQSLTWLKFAEIEKDKNTERLNLVYFVDEKVNRAVEN